jgi:hypothetical protein
MWGCRRRNEPKSLAVKPSSNCARWASETIFATSSQQPADREIEPVRAALPVVMALSASVSAAVRGLHVGLFAPYVVLLPSDSCPQSAPHDITSATAARLDSSPRMRARRPVAVLGGPRR